MGNNNSLVSICIPVFNGGALIHRALESAINQTYKNFEIIVVDNNSSDDTELVVNKYASRDKRIIYFKNEKNIGVTNNFIKSFSLASGDFIQLLCHDDWLSKNYIEEGLRNFSLFPDAASIFTKVVSLEADSLGEFKTKLEVSFRPGNYPTEFFIKNMYKSQWGSNCILSLMRRRDLVNACKFILPFLKHPVYASYYYKFVALDWLVFLKIIKNYEFLMFTDNSIYYKLDHPKNFGKYHGWNFKTANGRVVYYDFVRTSLEYVYREDWKKYLSDVRIFYGQELFNTLAIDFIKKHFSRSYFQAFSLRRLRIFFKDYSLTEKIGTVLYIIPYFVERIRRIIIKKIQEDKTIK